ncbi:hypothetical protein ANDO1_3743 [plant metagenome]|uniref:PLL-like beta propeller domain-containing protein n=1 Tax=plant metagenome TaxID=1297885 RepID=A0A484PR98_9ZZZZ
MPALFHGASRLALAALACLAFALPAWSATRAPTLADCHGIKDLAFVAHLDDDLLFMNPDLASNIEAGGCVRVVYLTASDAGEGEGYMSGRERGVRAAYAYMARQADEWIAGTATLGQHTIARYALQGNPRVELWHLRIKDPWLGPGWGSLTPLSQVESAQGLKADTLGPTPDSYSRADLVATLAELIRRYAPTTVRRLDDTITVPYTALCWRCAGHSHPDHIASARLVREAMLQAPGNYAETGYIDYPSQEREINLAEAEIASKAEIFRRYAWNDYHYCKGPEGCQEPAGPAAAWVQRAYYVSRADTPPRLQVDARGELLLLATGEANDAVNLWDANQRNWLTLGGRTASPLVSFSYPDASAGLFARDALGNLWVNRQQMDGAWQGWQAMRGARISHMPAVMSGKDTAAVAMGNDGQYYWTAPCHPGNCWNAWLALPALADALGDPVLARDAAGRYVVLALDRAGHLHATRQRQADPTAGWEAWRHVPAPRSDGGLAATRDADGHVVVYLRDRETRRLQRIDQVAAPKDAPNADALRWHAAKDLAVRYVGAPAVDADAYGNPIVAVLDRPDGRLWLVEHDVAAELPFDAGSPPALRFLHGTLYLAARHPGTRQRYDLRAREQDVWRTVQSLAELPAGGGSAFATPAAQPLARQ